MRWKSLVNSKKKFFGALIPSLVFICFVMAFFIWRLVLAFSLYHVPFSVQFSESDTPLLKAQIENRPYFLGMDLGLFCQLSLKPGVLESLSKEPFGIQNWCNFKGDGFQSQRYIIPHVEIGSLRFEHVIAMEKPLNFGAVEGYFMKEKPKNAKSEAEIAGDFGIAFIYQKNLLLDLKKAYLIVSNDFKKLKKEGYDLDAFIKIPIKGGPEKICFDVETDVGIFHCFLDTGATCTCLKIQRLKAKGRFDPSDPFPIVTSEKFVIEGSDFGPHDLRFINITSKWKPMEGVIGVDFLRKHAIYLDFKHQVAYIRP